MKKSGIVLIIIIVILLALLAILLYAYISDYKRVKESTADKILSAHLEGFPVGAKIEKRMKGEEKSVFKKDEWFGVYGTIQVNEDGELTFKIYDNNDNLIASNDQWKTKIEKGQGDFGMCCVEMPKDVGQYKVNLYFNDKLMKSLGFSVTD
jgi:hypothetical protein